MSIPVLPVNAGGVGPQALLIPMLSVRSLSKVNGEPNCERIQVGAPGRAYRKVRHDEKFVYYREEDGSSFYQFTGHDEHEKEHWKDKQASARNTLDQGDGYVFEVFHRDARGSMQGHLLTTSWDLTGDVIIGAKSYDYVHWVDRHLFRNLKEGKPCYASFDGTNLCKVEQIFVQAGATHPVNLEIVRRRPLFTPGPDGVLMHGLDFIADEARRKEQAERIQRIELGLEAMTTDGILDCAVVAEALLYHVGKQRLAGGKKFGQFQSVEKLDEQAKPGLPKDEFKRFREARFQQLVQSFVDEFGGMDLVKENVKRLPNALHFLRGWGNVGRHEVLADNQLVDADGVTSFACYGALREFVRLLQEMYRKVPGELCPPPKG